MSTPIDPKSLTNAAQNLKAGLASSPKSGGGVSDLLTPGASPYTQNARLIKFQLFEAGRLDESLPAQQIRGIEGLSTPYGYEVTCQSPDSGIESKKLMGLPAQIGILTAEAGGPNKEEMEVVRCGLVTRVQALGSDGGFARYRLLVEPPFALLRHRRMSRVFQDTSVPDILKTILDEQLASNPGFGKLFSYRLDLSAKYPPRSYCLQYRESDLHYLHRLLAEENIAYRFEHIGGQTDAEDNEQPPRVVLVAFDDPQSLPQAGQGEIRFHRAEATEAEDSLTEWNSHQHFNFGQVSLMHYDYKFAANEQESTRTRIDQGAGKRIEAALEDYDPQTHYYASLAEGLDRYTQRRQLAYDERKESIRGAGNARDLIAGDWFQLTEHPDFDPRKPEEAEFIITRLRFTALNNLPEGGDKEKKEKKETEEEALFEFKWNCFDLDEGGEDETEITEITEFDLFERRFAHFILDEGPPKAETDEKDEDTKDPPYAIELNALHRSLLPIPEFAHTELAKPRAPGVQTAIVVGPPGEEEVYTDDRGRIKIQFHWQRGSEHPGFGAHYDDRSSCWVRVFVPMAGAGWGMQYIPRIGQEVLVDFVEHDIDRPIVRGVIHNGTHANPYFSNAGRLPANRALSGIRTKEHYGAQYNELVLDDTKDQTRTKLSSEHGKTQLNQGFLIHPRTQGEGESRGEGFELRTDNHGAVRAAQGLLLTTEAKPEAQGKQLDRENAQSQLDSARKVAQEFSSTAKGQKAEPTEIGPETLNADGSGAGDADKGHIDHLVEASQAWEAGTNTDPEGQGDGQPGKQAILLASAQEGMGLVTPEEMVIAAGKNLDTIVHRDLQHTTRRRWNHHAGKKISLFVHGEKGKNNLKLTTAKGHMNIWAQSGNIEMTAEDNVYFKANKKTQKLVAAEEMVFKCAGAVVRLKGGNIELFAPGKISIKFGNYSQTGPASMETPRILFPEPGKIQHFLELNYRYAHNMQPMAGAPFTVELMDGSVVKGNLDEKGHARIDNIPIEGARDIRYGYEPAPMTPWREAPANPIQGKAATSEEEVENLLAQYLREEQEHLEDNYFPDEIEDMYAPYGAQTDYEGHYSYQMSNEKPEIVAYKKAHKANGGNTGK